MEVTFYGTYDQQMFLDAIKLTDKKSTLNTVLRYLALVLALVIIGGSLYAWYIEGMDQSKLSRIGRNIITGLFIGYYYVSPIISQKRVIASLFSAGPNRTMQGNANLEGISLGPKENRVTLTWDRFISKGEKDKLFALITVERSVAVFHRDFFATENDWQRFKHMANQRVIEPK